MEEFHIENFKFGLDTRRDVLTSQPGTLVDLSDALINPGGEIEKRKAFVDDSKNLAILDTNGSQGTFGLEVTSIGLLTFGSAIVFGGSVTLSQPTLVSAMPSGVTYQQLKHPSVSDGETYNATYHRMTSVVFSDNYNGNAFVAAQFSDGNVYLFYNGTLIEDSRNGMVLANHATLLELAQDFVAQLERISGWDGNAANATNFTGQVTVKSPAAVSFTPTLSKSSTNGQMGYTFVSGVSDGTLGAAGWAGFTYTRGGANQIGITAPAVAAGTGSVTLVPANTVFSTGSDTAYATDLVQFINSFTNSHGYTASNSANLVRIFPPTSWSVLPNPFNLVITYTGGTVTASSSGAALIVTLSTYLITLTLPPNASFTTASITATPSGGTGTYNTYLWLKDGGYGPFNLNSTSKANTSITGTAPPSPGQTKSAQFHCEVTDSGPTTSKSAILTVTVHATHP